MIIEKILKQLTPKRVKKEVEEGGIIEKIFKNRYFYLRKYLPLMDGWAFLSSLFGFLFILVRANFESSQIEKIFALSWWCYVFTGLVLTVLFHGVFRLLGINLEHKDSFVINSFILDGRINPNISNQNLQELFHQLKKESTTGFMKTVSYALPVIFASAITMYFAETSLSNIFIIFTGGFLSMIILGLLPIFLGEKFFANFLRECRKMFNRRGIVPKEEVQLITLRNKFYYFILLFGLIAIIILSFIPKITPFLLAIFAISFFMLVMLARILFLTLFLILQEIWDFASKLAQGERTEYFSGTSYEEILDLSRDFTKAGETIHQARKEEEKAREEAKEIKKELKSEKGLAEAHHETAEERKRIIERFYSTDQNLENLKLKAEILNLAGRIKELERELEKAERKLKRQSKKR